MNRRTAIKLLAAPALGAWAAPKANEYLVYIGTYTNSNKSKGIYAFRMDAKSGKLTPLGLAGEVTNPSFITIHPNRKNLYAVSEIANFQGQSSGAVTGFTMDLTSAKLTKLNTQPTKGGGACHLVVDRTGKNVVVANYGGGSVASIPIRDAEGNLGEPSAFVQHKGSSVDPKRQMGPHAHSVNISSDNRFVMVADLGLDQVLVYKFDAAAGTLQPNEPPFAKVTPGGGPRHFNFHPNGRFAYTNQEMKSAVTAFKYDAARGSFEEIQVISTLPAGFSGNNSTAEILVHPSGRFLYCSNRGHDSLAVYRIAKDGRLTHTGNVPTQGKTPRNFNIDPSGQWVIAANQQTDNIVVFKVNTKTGNLEPTGETHEVGAPVCVKFVPLG